MAVAPIKSPLPVKSKALDGMVSKVNKAPMDIPVKEKMLRRTINTITLPTLPIPKIFRMVRRKRRVKAVGRRGHGEKTERYEPIPAKAKEHFRRRLSHNPSPATVPVRGPKVLSK